MIASCTTISLLSLSEKDLGQSVFSLVLVIILAILPFLYTYVMYRNSVHLEMMSKKERIGSLYVNMDANSQANNNSKLIKDQNYEEFQDYVEDEIYEDVLFEQKPKENFYEHVSFNIYEPMGFK